MAARLGLCWGARPSRLPFSASRQKPFPKRNGSTGAWIVPIRSTSRDQPASKSSRPSPGISPAASWENSRSARNPQRRQARHICRIPKPKQASAPSGRHLPSTPEDVAPDGAWSVGGWRCYKYASPDGLQKIRVYRCQSVVENTNALCPVRPPQTAIGRTAGTLLGSATVPVAVFGVVPKTVPQTEWFHRSVDCPNPQHVARLTSIEIIPTVACHAIRCELGQLALR